MIFLHRGLINELYRQLLYYSEKISFTFLFKVKIFASYFILQHLPTKFETNMFLLEIIRYIGNFAWNHSVKFLK